MTHEMTVYPQKNSIKSALAKCLVLVILSTCILAQPASAVEQKWWFDVEVILFKRNLDAGDVSEQFKQSRLVQPPSDFLDLLTPYLKPDLSYLRAGLPYCLASNRLAAKTQYEQGFDFPLSSGKTNQLSLPQQNNKLKQGQQLHIKLTPDIHLIKPLAQIEWIEWQIPSVLLCAYAKQIAPSFASIIALQNDVFDTQFSEKIQHVSEVINGTEWQNRRSAFLLPTSSMYMSNLFDKINMQRNIQPILHLNWRQEVKFGRDKAQTIRLFAGKNFAAQFDANGLPLVEDTDSLDGATEAFYIPEELAGLTQQQARLIAFDGTESDFKNKFEDNADPEDLFVRITTALTDDTPLDIHQANAKTEQQTTYTDPVILKELWQIDGGITVYLRNVGRVPYLHIDSNLDFRQPIFDSNKAPQIEGLSTPSSDQVAIVVNQLQKPGSLQPNYLQSVNFNQLRRVISQQVHYFDHPLFGMVVRINRYRWPEIQSDDVEEVLQDN